MAIVDEALNEGSILTVYVHTYVLVTLGNVNLRSHSECQFALMSGQDIKHYTTTSGRRFLAMEDGEKNKKPKKSVHRRSQESDRRTRKSSKVESTY